MQDMHAGTQKSNADTNKLALVNPLQSRGNYSTTSNNNKLVHWAVTFGIVKRRLGGLRPHPVPSSLYQM